MPAEVSRIVPTVLDIAKNPATAREKAATAREFTDKRRDALLAVLKRTLALLPTA